MLSKDHKGFTLLEMLIVVAIIAILVAIAIPLFTGQLQKSKVATNTSNIKSAEELCSTTYMTDGASTGEGKLYIFDITTGSLLNMKDIGFTAIDSTSFGLSGCSDKTIDEFDGAPAFYTQRIPMVMYDGHADTYIKDDIYQTVVVVCTNKGVWACPYYNADTDTIAHDTYATL